MTREVLITGLGMMTSLGDGARANWKRLADPTPRVDRSGRRHSSSASGLARALELSEMATSEALCDAQLPVHGTMAQVDPSRFGCTLSASKPLFSEDAPRSPETLNREIRKRFGLGGECRNVIAACATGAYAVALGAAWIRDDVCDVVLAGSVEPYPHPLIESGFRQMGVMSDDGVTRPFDLRRSGFTFGEGAGVVVLESGKHARSRGVNASARLSGWALGADSHSAYAFNSQGSRISSVIDRTLEKAKLNPKAILHVNAHGTATRLNDWIETQALLRTFGPHASRLMISATKASTGHLLGASGSVELIYTILALKEQFIPPTETLEKPDPACPLDYTPGKGHSASFDHALTLSFGFGGSIGALVVSRP